MFGRSARRILGPAAVVIAVLVPVGLHLSEPGQANRPETGGRNQHSGALGHDYYVSPDGDDDFDGLSPGRAWKSLTHADTIAFRPGDRLLLRGGAHFTGSIRFDANDAGDATHPVTIGSYGDGRATIAPAGRSGIVIYDTAGVEIHDVAIAGDSAAYAQAAGIKLYSDLPGGRKLEHLTVSGVDVTGFLYGIEVGGGNGATGFRDVAVSDARLHGNRDAGMFTYGPTFNDASPTYAHENVSVDNVEAFDNPGNSAEHIRVTGSGIVLGSVRGGMVSHSTAHDNGAKCDSESGPVGIWAYDSTNIIIEHSISYHNRTAGRTDGGGFDFDQNVTSSVMQYNLSYENDGPGYMLFGKDLRHVGVTARFNISNDDARKSVSYGGISVLGKIQDVQVYQNTVLTHAHGSVRSPALLLSGLLRGVSVRNNIFMAVDSQLLVARNNFASSQVMLQGNDLYSMSRPWRVTWGSSAFSSFSTWRSATGQEHADSGDTGLSVNPGFVNTAAQKVAGLARARGFAVRPDSPVVGAGVDLRVLGVDLGAGDYFGSALSGPPTIGAAYPVSG